MAEKPTAEQTESARVFLTREDLWEALARNGMRDIATALRHVAPLLAATDPPTDEGLDAEAIDWCVQGECLRSPVGDLVAAYIAGARREGRR